MKKDTKEYYMCSANLRMTSGIACFQQGKTYARKMSIKSSLVLIDEQGAYHTVTGDWLECFTKTEEAAA